MPRLLTTLADILAPMTPEAFFQHHHGHTPVHIPGAPDKLAGVLTWTELTALVNQASLWTSATLELVLDTRKLPPRTTAVPARTAAAATR